MKIAISVALAATALVALSVAPANAACQQSFLLQSPGAFYAANGTGQYTAYQTDPVLSDNAKGFFWALGAGDPASNGDGSGPGIDNGTFDFSQWRIGVTAYTYGNGYYYNYFASMLTTWAANPIIDNCVADAADRGDRCTCVLITDQNRALGRGYFAVLGAGDNTFDNYPFDELAPVQMTNMPEARITLTQRNPDRSLDLTVAPVPAGGLYVDADCSGCGVLAYKVLAKEVPQNNPAPVDRDVADGWVELGLTAGGAQPTTGTPLGQSVTVRADCAGDTDLYLATQLLLDSGFSTPIVSSNTTKVACDPNLADPNPRPIQENQRPVRPLGRKPVSRRGR